MRGKLFAVYCAAIIATLAFANHRGYVVTSLFSAPQAAEKSVNRYHK